MPLSPAKFQIASRRLKFHFWVVLMINQTIRNYHSNKFIRHLQFRASKKLISLFLSLFCFFCSTLSLEIGRKPGNTSEDPKSKTCSFYGTILFKSQMLTCFGRIWRPVNILKCPMKKLQNGSKTHFFSYCLNFSRWPVTSNMAGGVININLLFLYRI